MISHIKSQGLRWYGATWTVIKKNSQKASQSPETRKPLSKVIDTEKRYYFRPYTYTWERVEQAESIIPLATVNPNGKAPETPSSKSKNKRNLVKTLLRGSLRRQSFCHMLCLPLRRSRYTPEFYMLIWTCLSSSIRLTLLSIQSPGSCSE